MEKFEEEIFYCHYCDKVLSEEKGEHDHGCLTCHGEPWQAKIDKLEADKKELVGALGSIQRELFAPSFCGDNLMNCLGFIRKVLAKIKSEAKG